MSQLSQLLLAKLFPVLQKWGKNPNKSRKSGRGSMQCKQATPALFQGHADRAGISAPGR